MIASDRIELDETADFTTKGYEYARIVKIGSYRVRARARRDSYDFQSHAVVEVLADDMTWTHLASEPTTQWFSGTRPPADYRRAPIDVVAELGDLVEHLLNRGAAILT
jgi:hypothetical protein